MLKSIYPETALKLLQTLDSESVTSRYPRGDTKETFVWVVLCNQYTL